jgi:hypothetical protein
VRVAHRHPSLEASGPSGEKKPHRRLEAGYASP